ncbi:DUF4432 family protein [Schumannella sp. 10F1B-5-1]|uniref:DUF4432 family protein n=1 Tax=Schumannella sp. 10F1B-5-1 TaxID=2590780 RepID=UPI0015E86FE9|nr:DUF4432 family protein [Schumannella sp. 10F1B-5-1]
MTRARRLLDAGLLAHDRAAVAVTERLGLPGSADPARVIGVKLLDGLDLEVLPDRGFDVGDVRLGGAPLSWISPVADARPLPVPGGGAWLDRFTGGLIATCGLRNIGPARDGQGLHGDLGQRPARVLGIERGVDAAADGGRVWARLRAEIDDAAVFGASLRVHRTLTVSSAVGADGRPEHRVELVDEVENLGPVATPVSLLYHVNVGAPAVLPGTRIDVAASRAVARDPHPEVPDWSTLPDPVDALTEAVFEHHEVEADDEGFAHARVLAAPDVLAAPEVHGRPGADDARADGTAVREIDVAWSAATLPRLFQWVLPTRGRWALGIEPANAPLFGPDRDVPHAGAPVLASGERRRHELRITFR